MIMNKITITKYSTMKDEVLGAWKYWHLIQFSENGYKYDLNMTDEGCMYLIQALERSSENEIVFIKKD